MGDEIKKFAVAIGAVGPNPVIKITENFVKCSKGQIISF
jgi:hypothetical protein